MTTARRCRARAPDTVNGGADRARHIARAARSTGWSRHGPTRHEPDPAAVLSHPHRPGRVQARHARRLGRRRPRLRRFGGPGWRRLARSLQRRRAIPVRVTWRNAALVSTPAVALAGRDRARAAASGRAPPARLGGSPAGPGSRRTAPRARRRRPPRSARAAALVPALRAQLGRERPDRRPRARGRAGRRPARGGGQSATGARRGRDRGAAAGHRRREPARRAAARRASVRSRVGARSTGRVRAVVRPARERPAAVRPLA